MTTLQQEIVTSFLKELDEAKCIDAQKIDIFRGLLSDGKKLRADDVIKMLTLSCGGDIK